MHGLHDVKFGGDKSLLVKRLAGKIIGKFAGKDRSWFTSWRHWIINGFHDWLQSQLRWG